MRDANGDHYAACSMPGCELTASEPPHKHEGKPVCPKHAAELAGGHCVACGQSFDVFTVGQVFGGNSLRVYPSREGRAVCIDCWAMYG
jgi:hypothetical protein